MADSDAFCRFLIQEVSQLTSCIREIVKSRANATYGDLNFAFHLDLAKQ